MTAAPTPTTPAATGRCTHAIPCLRYTDAVAAIEWLVTALGAEARQVHAGPDGKVAHAELWFGAACVMLGSVRDDGAMPSAPGQGAVYVVADSAESVDAIHERAVAAGARISMSLRDTDYGSHDFGCLDPEGNFWGFGTYAPERGSPAGRRARAEQRPRGAASERRAERAFSARCRPAAAFRSPCAAAAGW